MFRDYKNNREELQKLLVKSDEHRAKVLEIKQSVYRADKNSQRKVESLIAVGRMAVIAPFLAAGYVSDKTTVSSILTALVAIGTVLAFVNVLDESKTQAINEREASKLINKLIRHKEKESL